MSPLAASLLGFAAWFLALTFAVALWRVRVSLATAKPINSYAPDGSDLPGFGHRLTRARDNCFETLPIFLALVLCALIAGRLAALDALAPWVVLSRIAQTLTHVISTGPLAIVVRATMLAVQLAIYCIWAVSLATAP